MRSRSNTANDDSSEDIFGGTALWDSAWLNAGKEGGGADERVERRVYKSMAVDPATLERPREKTRGERRIGALGIWKPRETKLFWRL